MAESRCADPVAQAVSVEGSVDTRHAGNTDWQPVELNDRFCTGDSIRVAERSRAALMLVNETVMRLDQATTLTLTAVARESESVLDMLRGAAHFISRVPRNLKITTPFVNAGVEGTEFVVRAGADNAFVAVFEGTVIADNRAGSITLTHGQSATAQSGAAPQRQTVIKPRDAVEWTLYYPPVIDFEERELATMPQPLAKALTQSIAHSHAGDTRAALAAVQDIKPLPDDARFFSYRASLLLSVGRVDEARADIGHALALRADDADALALRSVIAIARNDVPAALQSAEQATTAAPDNAAAHLAQSYAHQAAFHLDMALEHARIAATLNPESAFAWARLAELRLMLHDLNGAQTAADKAVALNPSLARTQTVLGFAELIRIDTNAAISAFEKAVALDQADPLARLGLGLAQIRKGELEAGRRNMEIAAVLDPNRSLIRSYLGKAYYEERRDKLAGDQFSMAKDLDPNDPTPWLYDALRKQGDNRPVEALDDLQESVARNDNRAVYRSRLLLDEDQAARSANLARIYSEVGFGQLALAEGWKSVNTDPGNHSAHRFLADSYATLPRHEIARVSELLQAQLLQPLNLNPIQPQLAETDLAILKGAGPANASYNEFNPLFVRNSTTFQANAIKGGNGIWGDDIVVSGLQDRFSYSLGQFHYETDGFRPNSDLDRDIYNAFAQLSLTPSTTVQAEFRTAESDKGDLALRFLPGTEKSNFRETEDADTVRLGLGHRFSPRSQVIASVITQDFKLTQDDVPTPGVAIDFDRNDDATISEIQHLYRTEMTTIISGAGYFESDSDSLTTTTVDLGFPFPLIVTPTTTSDNNRHTNAYLYSSTRYPGNINWLLGVSADNFDGTQIDRDQINPKLGITWSPRETTTIRTAAFRSLKRDLVANQTIEPTQVAGFNQFFDDASGTDSKRGGIAIDQQLSQQAYAGIEFSKRDLDVPFQVGGITNVADWQEQLHRVYYYWNPTSHVSISAEYQYEDLEATISLPRNNDTVSLTTRSLPLSAAYHHPSGWFAKLTTTHIRQEGQFIAPLTSTVTEGSDRFWLADVSLGYRLPGRHGLISIEANNLFDQSFSYHDPDPNHPSVYPERLVFGRLSLWF